MLLRRGQTAALAQLRSLEGAGAEIYLNRHLRPTMHTLVLDAIRAAIASKHLETFRLLLHSQIGSDIPVPRRNQLLTHMNVSRWHMHSRYV